MQKLTNFTRAGILTAILLLFTLAAPAMADHSEFQVNIDTASNDPWDNPAIAMDTVDEAGEGGNIVIVWDENSGTYSGGRDIKARVYSASGVPLSNAPILVNNTIDGTQFNPDIAMDGSGNFVVVWQSSANIFGQRFDSSGNKVGGEFRVNTTTTGQRREPSIAMDSNGNFVVVYISDTLEGLGSDVLAQRFNSAGSPAGSEFRIHDDPANSQIEPDVAMDGDGNFVVVWRDYNTTLGHPPIVFRQFDSNGTAIGTMTKTRVNDVTNYGTSDPAVAINRDGAFVVVWEQSVDDPPYTSTGIYGKRYDENGEELGIAFLVNTSVYGWQRKPDVAMSDNSFVIAWHGFSGRSNYSIYVQAYHSNGTTNGPEHRLNERFDNFQQFPAIAMDDSGTYAAAWRNDVVINSQLRSMGIFGRVLDGPPLDNTAPVANDDQFSVQENETLTIAAPGVLSNDTDAEGSLLSAINRIPPTSGPGSSFSFNTDGSFTYTPPLGFTGTKSFDYIAGDDTLDSNIATVTITVEAANTSPTADAGGPYSGAEGSPVALDGSGSSDTDGDPLNYSWSVDSTLCDFDDPAAVSPNLTCADNGSYQVTLEVSDGQAATSAASAVEVTNVAPTIDAILAPADPVALDAQPVEVIVEFSDPGTNDTHTTTINWGDGTNDPSEAPSPVTASHTYAEEGVYTLQVAISDDDGNSDTTVYESVVIYNSAGPEVWAVDSSRDGLFRFDASTGEELESVGALDPDPAKYTTPVALTTVPGTGEILVWNNSDPDGVLLSVDPDTGLATPVEASTPVQNISMSAIAFGPDEKLYGTGYDGINYPFYQLNPSTGSANEMAHLPLRIGGLAFNSQGNLYGVELSTGSERLVTIDPATAAVTEIGILTEDIGIIGDIVFTADGRLIGTAFSSSLPAGPYIFFDINPATAEVTDVRPSSTFPPQGMGLVEPFSFTGGSTNNAPVAADDIYATNEDQPLNMGAPGVLSNDTDEGPLTAVLISDVSNGSLTFNADGSFTYSPSTDYYGQDSFTYTASDGQNESNIATAIIEVAPVNDAPSFTIGPDQAVLEASGLQAVPDWATEISAGPANESGQLLTFVVSNDNNALFAGQPAVTPDGTLLFEPAPDAYGSAELTVQLQDDGGTVNGGLDTSSPQTAVITVLPDSDGDGVADDADNAPSDYNPDQSDLDGDGTGDVADPCPNNANDSCDPSGSASTYVDPSEEVTLSTPDGSVSITFPPGALADGSSVSITDSDSGSLFEMTTDKGKVLGIFSVDLLPSQTFNVPVRITFAWDDIDDDGFVDGAEISEEDLVIVKDGAVLTGKCREEATGDGILPDCHTDANTFTFEVDSWSQFALAGALVPEVTGIAVPSAPVDINNQPISFTGAFADGDDDDAHAAQWDWGDGSVSSEGIVNQETNSVSGSHTYAEAGVYRVTLTVTDRFPNSGSLTSDYVVIYDPDGGFVTGGGWIDSPAGAYVPDPAMSGKATFGFVSKYKKGATVPTGNTEFQFRAADLNFHSQAYEYLVITGEGSNYAKFKGIGAINGEGAYNFMIWAGDKEPDTFRIKIWTEDEFGAETVIYDNGFDQPIGGGNIKVQAN